jgi:hypothetical protein
VRGTFAISDFVYLWKTGIFDHATPFTGQTNVRSPITTGAYSSGIAPHARSEGALKSDMALKRKIVPFAESTAISPWYAGSNCTSSRPLGIITTQ